MAPPAQTAPPAGSAAGSPPPPATLYDVCSKLLLYLVTFNRRTKRGETPNLYTVRNELDAIFAEQAQLAQANPAILPSYQMCEYPLIVTADEVLINSRWAYGPHWENGENLIENRRYGTRVGGEKFYQELARVPLERPDVLEIYYACMCIGFRGTLRNDRDTFIRTLQNLYLRLPAKLVRDERTLFPDAYAHTKTEDLTRPAALNLIRLLIVAAGFVVVFFIAGRLAFDQAVADVIQLATDVAAQWADPTASK